MAEAHDEVRLIAFEHMLPFLNEINVALKKQSEKLQSVLHNFVKG